MQFAALSTFQRLELYFQDLGTQRWKHGTQDNQNLSQRLRCQARYTPWQSARHMGTYALGPRHTRSCYLTFVICRIPYSDVSQRFSIRFDPLQAFVTCWLWPQRKGVLQWNIWTQHLKSKWKSTASNDIGLKVKFLLLTLLHFIQVMVHLPAEEVINLYICGILLAKSDYGNRKNLRVIFLAWVLVMMDLNWLLHRVIFMKMGMHSIFQRMKFS